MSAETRNAVPYTAFVTKPEDEVVLPAPGEQGERRRAARSR